MFFPVHCCIVIRSIMVMPARNVIKAKSPSANILYRSGKEYLLFALYTAVMSLSAYLYRTSA